MGTSGLCLGGDTQCLLVLLFLDILCHLQRLKKKEEVFRKMICLKDSVKEQVSHPGADPQQRVISNSLTQVSSFISELPHSRA